MKWSAQKYVGEEKEKRKTNKQKLRKHPSLWVLQVYFFVSDEEHADIAGLILSLWKPGHGCSMLSNSTFNCYIMSIRRAGPTIFRIFHN